MRCSADPQRQPDARAVARIVEAAEPRRDAGLPARAVPHASTSARPRTTRNFDLAEPIPGPIDRGAGRGRAREAASSIIASLFERRAAGRLPQHRGRSSTPTASCWASTARCTSRTIRSTTRSSTSRPATSASAPSTPRCGRIGTLVCWDQWYPEAARLTALRGRRRALLPDGDRLAPVGEGRVRRRRRRRAWQTMQRAHAIANGVYVAAVNRVGHEKPAGVDGDGIEFWGGSFVADPFGQIARRGVARRGRDADRHLRSPAPGDRPPALAVPARPPHRRLRRDHAPVPRRMKRAAIAVRWRRRRTAAGRARLPHARRVGAARGDLDRLAARAARLAGQARRRSPGSTARWCATWRVGERVRILVVDRRRREARARGAPARRRRSRARASSSAAPTDRSWTRDYCPLFVTNRAGEVAVTNWRFNGWAKYAEPQARRRGQRPHRRAATSCASGSRPRRSASASRASCWKAAPSTSTARGTLLATEECLLDKVQARNPGLAREALEARAGRVPGRAQGAVARARHRRRRHARPRRRSGALRRRDARSSSRRRATPPTTNYAPLRENRARLERMTTADGRPLRVAVAADARAAVPRRHAPARELRELLHRQRGRARADVQRPATTAPRWRSWPRCSRPARVVGIHAVDLVWGLGTLHCMTQQEPAGDRA